MKRISLGIAAPIALLLIAAAPRVFSDEHDQKTDVTITEAIQVPGAVLQPGKYMFILLNSSSDRHIVEVKSEDGKHLYSMSFATAARRVIPTDKVSLTFYEMPAGSPPALRQWFWPGQMEGQELLYSHQQAADIRAGSHQAVSELTDQEASSLAAQTPVASNSSNQNAGDQTASVTQPSNQTDASVDQSSQQLADQPLQPQGSKQSVESKQTVDQDQPVQQAQVVEQPQPVAQPNPPADNSANNTIAQNYAPTYTPAPVTQASNTDPSSDNASLPKTASDLPLIGLIGLVSLASAVSLRVARKVRA
jgi:hypothetical protein